MRPCALACSAAVAMVVGLLPAGYGQKVQFSITGTVLNATTGDPVANAHLVAATADEHNCAGTRVSSVEGASDAQGAFALAVPCAGVWHLTASGSGFPTQDYEQHETFYTGIVLTQAVPTLTVRFAVTPVSAIQGFVLDEAGEPVREARVTLLNANMTASQQQLSSLASATSDDRGFYEFPNLLGGNYLIAVQAQPWYAAAAGAIRNASQYGDPNLDLTYPITYFPSSTDPLSASVIALAPGATQQADLHLSPVPSIHVTLPAGERRGAQFVRGALGGQLGGPLGGGANRGRGVSEFSVVTPFGSVPFQPTNVALSEDGSMDIGGFAPGSYSVAEPGAHGRDEERLVTLQSDGARTVALASVPYVAASSSSSAASVRLVGATTLKGAPAVGTMVLLVAAAPPDAAGHFKVFRQQSNTDGSFIFARIPAGNYILVALQNGWGLRWSDPAVLSTFLMQGTPLKLTATTTLAQPIVAQVAGQ